MYLSLAMKLQVVCAVILQAVLGLPTFSHLGLAGRYSHGVIAPHHLPAKSGLLANSHPWVQHSRKPSKKNSDSSDSSGSSDSSDTSDSGSKKRPSRTTPKPSRKPTKNDKPSNVVSTQYTISQTQPSWTSPEAVNWGTSNGELTQQYIFSQGFTPVAVTYQNGQQIQGWSSSSSNQNEGAYVSRVDGAQIAGQVVYGQVPPQWAVYQQGQGAVFANNQHFSSSSINKQDSASSIDQGVNQNVIMKPVQITQISNGGNNPTWATQGQGTVTVTNQQSVSSSGSQHESTSSSSKLTATSGSQVTGSITKVDVPTVVVQVGQGHDTVSFGGAVHQSSSSSVSKHESTSSSSKLTATSGSKVTGTITKVDAPTAVVQVGQGNDTVSFGGAVHQSSSSSASKQESTSSSSKLTITSGSKGSITKPSKKNPSKHENSSNSSDSD